MVFSMGLLLGCQLIGEVLTRSAGLPLPGPVAGLLLLLLLLRVRPALTEKLRPTVSVTIANLSLLFVPAGVGVIGNLGALSETWIPLLVVLVASTVLAMLVAVGTFIAATRLTAPRPHD